MRKFNQKVMWFRAIDIPSLKPPFFKYHAQKSPEKFEKFSDFDSNELEAAYFANEPTKPVLSDGLFTVDMKNRLIRPTYWDGPQFKVIRGTWFKQSNMQPADEALATKLENLWKQAHEDPVIPFKGTIDGKPISIKATDGIVTATVGMSLIDTIRNFGDSGSAYVRGYNPPTQLLSNVKAKLPSVNGPDKAQKEETEAVGTKYHGERDREVEHLVFCIHGIGQKLGQRFDFVSFIKDTGLFRTGLHKAFVNSKEAQATLGQSKNNKVQVLPVLWRQNWEFDPSLSHPTFDGVTPETVFFRDNVLADVVLDFVIYLAPEVRKQIQNTTIELINEQYKKFCELNPTFAKNPKVSIVAHSLGSVIANDIFRLDDYPFPFQTENVFFLGSPVGILDLISGIPFNKEGIKAHNVFNIMRPSDPVASRLEPMVCGKIATQIVPMPLSRKDDSLFDQIIDSISSAVVYTNKLASGVNSVFQTVTSALLNDKTKPSKASLKPVPEKVLTQLKEDLAPFNRHHRLDFSIPESLEISLAIGLAGHMTYFESPEVASFVLQELYKLGKVNCDPVLEKDEPENKEDGKI